MTDDLHAELGQYIQDHLARLAAAREEAVESAIRTGLFGVLEEWHPGGRVSFTVHPSVPYGNIHVKGRPL